MTRNHIGRLALASVAFPGAASALTEPSPQARLAGRVAGPPVDCVSDYDRDRGGGTYKDGSILYEGRGSTLYVNRPEGCPAFRSDDAVISRTPSTRLCRGDIIQVVQNTSGIFRGSCALGRFTPYSRAK